MISEPFDTICEMIFPQLGGNHPRRNIPQNAALYKVADQFDIHFVVYTGDDEGREATEIITTEHLNQWGVNLETLARIAGENSGDVSNWNWSPVNPDIRLFEYPEHDEHWVAHILSPGCLLEHTDVPSPPIIMIPNPNLVYIAGLPDHDAQRVMFERSIKTAGSNPPLTRRPLVINDDWTEWRLLPDTENPLAADYQACF